MRQAGPAAPPLDPSSAGCSGPAAVTIQATRSPRHPGNKLLPPTFKKALQLRSSTCRRRSRVSCSGMRLKALSDRLSAYRRERRGGALSVGSLAD